jgi:UDP-N-acetylglucosamine--N-acetylmuramyl-(pentapeptide) pyrophosphoryl-undecaprenol N-acetylglucosamine transferase
MRAYFGVCGVGLGHVGRCIPVAKKLRSMGNQILFSTYLEACDFVKREQFPLCNAPPISFAIRPDGGVDFQRTTVYPGIFSIAIFLRQLNAEIEFMRSFQPDFVISDSRVSTLVAAKILDIPSVTILNIYKVTIPRERRFLNLARIADGGVLTIIGKIWTFGKKILIPDFPYPYTLSLSNLEIPPSRKEKIKLIGPILPTQAKDLPPKHILRKKLGYDDRPLIFVPISGASQEKEYFTQIIQQILQMLPDDYQVVVSLGQPNSGIKSYRQGNVLVYPWITNRFEHLKACDLVISRAGLGTLSQALCYGKPLLLVPTPSQTEQRNNAQRACELGVAKILDQKEIDYARVYTAITEILGSNHFLHRTKEIKNIVESYDATDTLVKIISSKGKAL